MTPQETHWLILSCGTANQSTIDFPLEEMDVNVLQPGFLPFVTNMRDSIEKSKKASP